MNRVEIDELELDRANQPIKHRKRVLTSKFIPKWTLLNLID